MRAYGPHRMRNISEYIYEISGVKINCRISVRHCGGRCSTHLTLLQMHAVGRFKVPTAMLAALRPASEALSSAKLPELPRCSAITIYNPL